MVLDVCMFAFYRFHRQNSQIHFRSIHRIHNEEHITHRNVLGVYYYCLSCVILLFSNEILWRRWHYVENKVIQSIFHSIENIWTKSKVVNRAMCWMLNWFAEAAELATVCIRKMKRGSTQSIHNVSVCDDVLFALCLSLSLSFKQRIQFFSFTSFTIKTIID